MDSVVPWADLLAAVEPHRPAAGHRGRQPWPTETLHRMFLVRAWLDLSDEGCEDACYDSLAVRDFVGCWDGVPDATTLVGFRHLVERESLDRAIFDAVLARLEASGLIMHGGSVVDATIVTAPSSTKNRSGSRDPETRQTRKVRQWYHGTRCHSGKDAGTGYVHSCAFTATNAPDVSEAHNIVCPDDLFVYADSGYRGVARREEVASDGALSGIELRVALGPSKLRTLGPAWLTEREGESRKASVRPGAEHPYHILKQTFGYARCRYRGLAKNAARIRVLLASANLLMVALTGRAVEFLAPTLAAAWRRPAAPPCRDEPEGTRPRPPRGDAGAAGSAAGVSKGPRG